jgi:serine protease Do
MSTDTTTDPLTALEDAARTVADRVGPATVAIGRSGRGSGVVVAPGRVLTNAHNLRDRTTQVTFGDGRREQGSVSGADPSGDLVVLEVDTGDVAPVEFATDGPTAGSVVFAVARGLRGTRIGFGLVSGTQRPFRGPRGRRISGGVEHSAPLARGSSGGPLVDRAGRVVGINTHRLGQGFYLAQPTDEALRAKVDRMGAGADVSPPTLGVAVAPPEVARRLRRSVGLEDRTGVLVREVDDDGAAARAGIRPGDLLVTAGGAELGAVDDLFDALDAVDPTDAGGTLEVGLVRGSEELSVTVSFAAED